MALFQQNHNWPGNVRQLRNCLERACALALDPLITEDQLTITDNNSLQLISDTTTPDNSQIITHQPLSLVGKNLTLAELDRAHIRSILIQTRQNREKAAAVLGISSRTLYRKIKDYQLDEAPII